MICAGILAWNIVILARISVCFIVNTKNRIKSGAISNLYESPAIKCLASCFHSLNFSCNPIEKSANGDNVARILSNNGFIIE